MNVRVSSTFVIALALGLAAAAQNVPPPPPQGQDGGGPRGAGRGFGGGMGMGHGVSGTVAEVTPDHYTVKTDTGETYTVHYSVNTRILKQQARQRGPGGGGGGERGQGGQGWGGGGGNPPQEIKPTDIKVGDAIAAMGEVDAAAKSVGAIVVMQIDPERAKEMRAMRENFGKTWIMGKVTAIDGAKVTLMSSIDNAAHTFVADENTIFRQRRQPITLADIQVGDNVRAEGAVKDGNFVATAVNAMGQPPAGTPNVPRTGPPSPPQ